MVGSTRKRPSAQFYVSPSIEDDSINEASFVRVQSHSEARSTASRLRIIPSRMRRKLRSRRFALLAGLLLLGLIGFYIVQSPSYIANIPRPASLLTLKPSQDGDSQAPPSMVPPATDGSHPIWTLMTNARREFEELNARQSKSLAEAVAEYQRRYSIHPPPNFDIWYNFAKKKGIQLIDEYDVIHQSLTPFWGLKPSVIRARAREALGYDNTLLGVLVRGGNVTRMEGGRAWMQKAIDGMTAEYLQYIPDMDICFNVHDEPRVVLPHDDLVRLIRKATDVTMPAALAVEKPRNGFSGTPDDINEGRHIDEIGRTRFNYMSHQASWGWSRMSCSPDSPARSLEEPEDVEDQSESYALEPLGFIYNQTAFTDICLSPSLSSTHGFFSGPNSFNIAQDLFPIFSQSKISSFQDIIYPSPWYWAARVPYDEKADFPWQEKESKMYWRGSTTGGYSRYGSWRNQHRQRFVAGISAQDNAKILTRNNTDPSAPSWAVKEVFRPDYSGSFDVKFSEIGQCDKGDCAAQKEFFTVVSKAAPQEAWKYKYLIDMDGNAFSGRFYAFLMSKSLVYKLAIFREWHSEIVKPWVHYVPLSLKGNEWLESLRWFAGEEDGKAEAERLAVAGSDWAKRVLRNEDMEVWLFRLLLEYGRLIDDDRENIGFTV